MRTQRPALGGAAHRSQGSPPVASQPPPFATTFVNGVRPGPRSGKADYLIAPAVPATVAPWVAGVNTPVKISMTFCASTSGALET